VPAKKSTVSRSGVRPMCSGSPYGSPQAPPVGGARGCAEKGGERAQQHVALRRAEHALASGVPGRDLPCRPDQEGDVGHAVFYAHRFFLQAIRWTTHGK
jgi:hypothetical protein